MATQEIDLGNVQGPKGDPGPQGPQGEQGPEGPQGPPGEVDVDTAIEFTQAASRVNLVSGESIKTLFGKVMKWFADLKAVAFSGSYNDLSDKPSSLPANGGNSDTVDGKHATDLQNYNSLSNKPTIVNNGTTTAANTILDGRMGKTLADKDANLQSQITSLNSSLTNVKVYSDLVGITFTPDGASQENSWGTYFVPEGYCFLSAVIADNEQLQGKYVGIVTQRYNKTNRMVSLYINWRYSGVWEVLITLAKEKR